VTEDIDAFLASLPVVGAMAPGDRAELAAVLEPRRFPAHAVILAQGEPNRGLYLLRQGALDVRVRRGTRHETIAEIAAPAYFGELSFLTGRPASATVAAATDVETLVLAPDGLARLGASREVLMRALLDVVASRLHDVVSRGPVLDKARTVWLTADAAFPAPRAFAHELAVALSALRHGNVLLMADGPGSDPVPRQAPAGAYAVAALPANPADLPALLRSWRDRFRYVVAVTPGRDDVPRPAADVVGHLVAGASSVPSDEPARTFVAADASRTRLDRLTGRQQLLFDADAAAVAFRAGAPVPERFRRTAGSLARAVAGCQVGLALGGGGACCWAHIGLLTVLADAGVPIDVVAGCSMGSLIGALLSSGRTVEDMTALADTMAARYLRMIEPRFWRMHVVSDRKLWQQLRGLFGDRTLQSLEVPFWANAVDIQTGTEVVLDRVEVATAVRASMALPGSSPPLELNGQVLVDAAILAPVPVGPVRGMGADYVVAMNVMPAVSPGTIATRNPLRFYEVLDRALRISGHELGNHGTTGDADVLLTPALEEHGLADFRRARDIIQAGTIEAEHHRHQISAAYAALVAARA